jgi:hypothetical protein
MKMPGFAAEASLYKTSEQYRLLAAPHNDRRAQVVQLSLPVSVSCSGGGMDCFCTGGCIRKKGGWCCCAGDANCPPRAVATETGGLISL